jgi:haloacetate dehalogenase
MQLPGFEYQRIDVDGVTINCAVSGSGPPVLLLHGYPENHLAWRDVAPALTEHNMVVVADLRGYGDSGKPVPDIAGGVYSNRAMAHDQVGLMRRLGFERFQLAGHDRGARVAHRLVLDHPGTVTRLAILDILPTRHTLHHLTPASATGIYFWFLMAAGNGVAEHVIAADPGYWVESVTAQLLGDGASITPEAMYDYIRCLTDPAAIAGTCADFRSSLGADLALDDDTHAAGQKIECPVLLLWGSQGMNPPGDEPLNIWQQYAPDIRGHALPTGHFLPEEAPGLTGAALREFLD